MALIGVPRETSSTVDLSTAPESETSVDPGLFSVPSDLNQSAPNRAISATLAHVSALSTSTGLCPTRRMLGRSGRYWGRDSLSFNQ